MAVSDRDRQYFVGLAVGLGIGVFLALVLAEDGDLASGIKPGTMVWKLMKLGGLALAVGGGVYQALAGRRSKQALVSEPKP